ncbi:hypothetical protein [Polluticoccus soli]|uniref:hypothetical protein n=1 Tax=Polluticoccus soli TaxID=3034150 RepID=UPI0023E15BE3|nr:hypothetical protein [Flavipsychrobacter sp. JY13-12]
MATFVSSQQDPKYRIHNMAVNIEHVKSISKETSGFNYTIIFQFNEKQSFEWNYRFSSDRDADFGRLEEMLQFKHMT